jgi:hypothetical protein
VLTAGLTFGILLGSLVATGFNTAYSRQKCWRRLALSVPAGRHLRLRRHVPAPLAA